MTKRKMPAVLLAGLMILALAGCGADKTENTGSDPASAESGITATATDNASEPTDESSLPAGTESATDSTTEKEKESSTAPANSGKMTSSVSGQFGRVRCNLQRASFNVFILYQPSKKRSICCVARSCNFSMNAALFRRLACRPAALLAVWGRQ